MWRAREAMATTSFVGVRESENGFEGSSAVVGTWAGFDGWWMCRVESQEADISIECCGL